MGVSALRYPSGQADPLDIGGQVSISSATGIVVAEIHAEHEQSPADAGHTTTSRQPSATAAAARLPPEGPSLSIDLLSLPNSSMHLVPGRVLLTLQIGTKVSLSSTRVKEMGTVHPIYLILTVCAPQ